MKKKIVTPRVPNFIRVEVLRAFFTVPLSELDDDELDEMAKQWRFALYENRDRQRKNGTHALRASDRSEK